MAGLPHRPWPFLTGASVQGSDHRALARGCEDAFRAAIPADRTALIMAVADGAGGQQRGALGAQIAVDAACRMLLPDRPGAEGSAVGWQAWISARITAIIDEYQRIATAVGGGELGSTLAAAVICPPWAAFCSVGDCFGAVLAQGDPERCHLILPPPSGDGEFTVFLSSPAARSRARSFVVWDPGLTGVLLATDGCKPLALDHPSFRGLPPSAGPQPVPAFFVGLAQAVRAAGGDGEPVHTLLTGPEAARCTDDLTVVCALAAGG